MLPAGADPPGLSEETRCKVSDCLPHFVDERIRRFGTKHCLDISGRQMTDEKGKQTGLDNDFVSLEEPWQLHYWTTKLKCTPDELRAAIAEVGNAVVKIRAFLKKE